MKQLIGYLKDYYKNEFNWGYGIFILLFAGMLLYLNFYFPGTNYIHRAERWKSTTFFYHLLLYSSTIGVALLSQRFFFPGHELRFLKDYRFWLVILFGILIWSFRGGLIFYYTKYIIADSPRNTIQTEGTFRIIYILLKTGLALIPLYLFWWFVDRKEQPLYGMHKGKLNLRPYLVLLLLMIPVIVIASQNPGFLRTYPRAQLIRSLELFNPDHAGYLVSYEAIYVLDFYVIELFFRGFMILALMKYAGPKIILPTAIFYCALHFGKPFGEALSSLFGGTILGIITYYSRSIWGGIIIHMGIALAMELSAYITLSLK